jgi:hypothetical protein
VDETLEGRQDRTLNEKWEVRTLLPFTAVRFFFGEMRFAIPNIIRLLWNKKEQLKVLRGESIC